MRISTAFATVASVGIASAAALGIVSCSPGTSDPATIRRLEDQMALCMKRQDAPCVDSLLAPGWSARWADGSWQTKAEYLASVAKHADRYDSTTTDSLTLQMFGDAAVVRGVDTELATFSGKDGSGRYAWLDIFVKTHGRWQLVVSQSTKLP
jgi:hypothetical protein